MDFNNVVEKTDTIELTFRGEKFTCKRRYFHDLDTDLKFSVDEQDDEIFWQIIDAYALRHPEVNDLPKKE